MFDKIVDKGQYSEKDACNLVKQIVAAVQYMHEHGVCHRDLKVNYPFKLEDFNLFCSQRICYVRERTEKSWLELLTLDYPKYLNMVRNSRQHVVPLIMLVRPNFIILSFYLLYYFSPRGSGVQTL